MTTTTTPASKPNTLGALAAQNPAARVRLVFRSERGLGTLETTAAHAANPNKSGRYFPPEGESAVTLGWPELYWYASEVLRVVVL